MRYLARAALGFAACAMLGACSTTPKVIAAADPNPRPPPGYRVECVSRPGILYPVFHDFYSHCAPALGPFEERVVVRAKG